MNEQLIPPGERQELRSFNLPRFYLVTLFFVGFAMFGLGVCVGWYKATGMVNNNDSSSQQVAAQISPAVTTIPTATVTSSGEIVWKKYAIPTVNMAFLLPNTFGELEEQFVKGSTGTELCLVPKQKTSLLIQKAFAGGGCNSNFSSPLRVGTTSIDYEAGRGGSFTDLQGFTQQNGKYYGKFVDNQLVELPQIGVTKVTNGSGVEVLKVKAAIDPNQGPSLTNSLNGGIGILVNTSNKTYPGMAMVIQVTGEITENVVDQIIESIYFSKN